MRFTATTVLAFLSVLSATSARPACHYASVLTSSPSASSLRDLPVGKTAISRNDMAELGRLAIAVNSAYCPHENRLQPHPPTEFHLQNVEKRKRSSSRQATSIIMTSDEVAGAESDMRWYISHTPSSQTLTLAFSSLRNVDDLLELLATSPSSVHNSTSHLVDLPVDLFPTITSPLPKMHHSFAQPLAAHGVPALDALLNLLDSPPMTSRSHADILHSYIAVLTGSRKAPAPVTTSPIRKVEIVGHGLGSAVGLLVATALQLRAASTPIDISATLFGLPRVGDQAFADLVDSLVTDQTLRLHRITSYADTIAHLPERHQLLAHPSLGEIWIGADPRVAYACKSATEGMESEDCAASIALAKTSVLDHSGPFGGVWISPEACRRV